ncbi:pirin family protein [Glaciecola sp. KUL10]|uniref:pirin family protein n=1 Tax=Glaciecola sp. (strain KUL10) TaxID=2161813 RepID=UPI000D78708F|nr:pirin family protein [Glaciecola sp. KUL10]GBL03253.1 PIRIN-like protein [Glaciecola sp. KUL10]
MTTIKQIVNGMPASDGAGVKLKRVLGQPLLKRLDPFLMLDEFGSEEAQDYIAGFPQHPHRGFQTVTYMLNGKMGHKDSVGNTGIIEDGGLQWMNAGKGIIHEEMPQQTSGKMRGFQLWVNLPADQKMSMPGYQDIPSTEVPEVQLDNGNLVRVLAGEFDSVTGAVTTQAVKPLFLDVHLTASGNQSIELSQDHNGFIYVYEGELTIAGKTLSKGQLGVLDIDGKLAVENNNENEARLIVVTGKPINEPVVQYGPFVMNTEAEINQALSDFRTGALA